MTNIPFEVEKDDASHAVIKVIGVGGGGSNAVDSMIKSGLDTVEYTVINTDIRALEQSSCENKIQIGEDLTKGLGSGGQPSIGQQAAEDAIEEIQQAVQGADMLFITAGLGGGTGTGAGPIVARVAKEMGALTVAIMTKPFRFEGPQRQRKAMQGIEQLREYVDTMILISNDRLLEVIDRSATLLESFAIANTVLTQGVESISELISVPGLINVDFADVRAIMGQTGGAVMGIGIGRGEQRSVEAVQKACSSPLLDKIVIDGAQGVLISIAGGSDLKLFEVNEAMTQVYEKADPEANIIFGAVIDEKLEDEVRVTIIATGFNDDLPPQSLKSVTSTTTTTATVKPPVIEKKVPLKSPTSPVSLEAKLESMIGEKSSKDSSKENGKIKASENGNGDGKKEGKENPLDNGNFEIEIDSDGNSSKNAEVEEVTSESPAYLRKKDLLQ